MNTFCIKTLGCKTNQLESGLIVQNLLENGFEQVEKTQSAEYFIINSCSVTSHTDKQTLSLIKQAKKKNKDIKVVLTGCLAQLLKEKPDYADIILGNDEKLNISKHLEKSEVKDIFSVSEFNNQMLKKASTTRPFVKIQEGCDNRCSYCIIPHARGKSRSNSIENIIGQINTLAQNGHKEIVFTGTHLGQWGKECGMGLIELLKKVEKSDIHRYRLGSLYTNEITDEIIEVLAKSEKFCPHFHLSLQSLCDKTLKDMNRNYRTEEVFALVEKLKKTFNLPFLGCDIIAGFPGEREEDFETTYKNLAKCGLSKIHAFPYSIRKGTPAADMKEQIPESIKKERTRKLISLSQELYRNFLNENTGRRLEVLYEKKPKGQNKNTGITRNYIRIFKESNSDLQNTLELLTLREEHFLNFEREFAYADE